MPITNRPANPIIPGQAITADYLNSTAAVANAARRELNLRRAIPPQYRPLQFVVVKITGDAAGDGKYLGTLWTDPLTAISASGNLSESELGTAGADVLIVNLHEADGASTSGHDLTAGTPKVTKFIGRVLPVRSTTGLLVVEINGIDTGCGS